MAFTELTGAAGSFAQAGNTVNYNVSSTSNLDFNVGSGYGDIDETNYLINYDIGPPAGAVNEMTTFSFDQAVSGFKIRLNASHPTETFEFFVNGASVNLNTWIASGDATFTTAGDHTLETDGTLTGTGVNDNVSSEIVINVPMSKFSVASETISGGGSRMEVLIDDAPIAAPCFTPGSLISTQRGDVLVETLAEGDMVLTRDNGYQPLRWVFQKQLSKAWLTAVPGMLPVMIRKGVFGATRDVMVSPGHLMLIAEPNNEVFIPAHRLLGMEGVFRAKPLDTGYIHLLFDDHQVVRVDGMWSESFQPNAASLSGLEDRYAAEVYEIFPELADDTGTAAYKPARKILYAGKAKRFVAGLMSY